MFLLCYEVETSDTPFLLWFVCKLIHNIDWGSCLYFFNLELFGVVFAHLEIHQKNFAIQKISRKTQQEDTQTENPTASINTELVGLF